jgi:hypothetical protein
MVANRRVQQVPRRHYRLRFDWCPVPLAHFRSQPEVLSPHQAPVR